MTKVSGIVLDVITKKPIVNSQVTIGVIESESPEPKTYQMIGIDYTEKDGTFEFSMHALRAKRYNYQVYSIGSSDYQSGDDYYLGNKKLLEFYNELMNNNSNTISKKGENKITLYAFQLAYLNTNLINEHPFNTNDSITVWAKTDGFEDIINSCKGLSNTPVGVNVPIPAGFITIHWKVIKNNITKEYSDTMTTKIDDYKGYTIEY